MPSANQPKTASTKAAHMTSAAPTAAPTDAVRSSAASQGTRPIHPSTSHDHVTRAYSARATALAAAPATTTSRPCGAGGLSVDGPARLAPSEPPASSRVGWDGHRLAVLVHELVVGVEHQDRREALAVVGGLIVAYVAWREREIIGND